MHVARSAEHTHAPHDRAMAFRTFGIGAQILRSLGVTPCFVSVPGAFETPLALKKLAETRRFSALIALGCVIRGATAHFDYVAGEASRGISQVSLTNEVPIGFGLLTVDTIEQAIERAGTKGGNKGADAALAAIQMATLFKKLEQ